MRILKIDMINYAFSEMHDATYTKGFLIHRIEKTIRIEIK